MRRFRVALVALVVFGALPHALLDLDPLSFSLGCVLGAAWLLIVNDTIARLPRRRPGSMRLEDWRWLSK